MKNGKAACKKILIVDDDSAILEAIKIVLEDNNYDVFVMKDGKSIKEKIKNILPDLILLDIWLPGENGDKIAKTLKKESSTKDIPIILISANQDIKKLAQDSGADDFLPKPFDLDSLLSTVEKNISI